MSLIWAARRGLAEIELLDLLGRDGEPLKQTWWLPFFFAADASLASHDGLVQFGHSYLRDAVSARYFAQAADVNRLHGRLIDYFASQPTSVRQAEELAWHLQRAGEWERLAGLLEDPDFLAKLWENDPAEPEACWARIEEHSDIRVADRYETLSKQGGSHLWMLFARILERFGAPQAALRIWEMMEHSFLEQGDSRSLGYVLNRRGAFYIQMGKSEEALGILAQAESI
jgi:hypothetical protein